MSQPPLSPAERAELVAYLDGELSGDAARAVEARISLNPHVRAEAESLRRTWDLLDYLPRTDPSPRFTERTLSRIDPPPAVDPVASIPLRGRLRWWRPMVLGLGWAALLLVAAFGGYRVTVALLPHEAGDKDLLRDLRLIENKRFYDLVDDVEFLRKLDDPDLFGDDAGGT
ncbi:MAG: hypothetical protein U0736_18080 [Gemmataceae bacterium]